MKTKSKITKKRLQAGQSRALAVALGWPLKWDTPFYDNDGSHIEAVGGTTDGESGDLYYRLEKCRSGWIEASSPELMLNEKKPRRWKRKDHAMRDIQRRHDAIMRDYSSSAHGVLTQEIEAHAGKLAGTSGKGNNYEAGFVAALEHVRDNIMPLLANNVIPFKPLEG